MIFTLRVTNIRHPTRRPRRARCPARRATPYAVLPRTAACPRNSEEPPVILSVSGVLLLGIIAFLFFRKDGMKLSHAIVCALFGFYLASTAIAPSIRAGGASFASLLGGIKF